MLSRFQKYLEFIDSTLANMFEKHKQYIKCKKGCAYCCKKGEFPLSELEYVNLMFYYNSLESNIKDVINENIDNLLNKQQERLYSCPFLINNTCSVYPARAIICRTFGLIWYNAKQQFKIPFCVDLDLNYSNVYDKNTKKLNQDADINAFNIDRTFLRNKKFEKAYDIFFGEDKPLIEWLKEENFNE